MSIEKIMDKTTDGFYLLPTICMSKKRRVFYDLTEFEIKTIVFLWFKYRFGFREIKEIEFKPKS